MQILGPLPAIGRSVPGGGGNQFGNYFAGGSFRQLQSFSAPIGCKLLATYSGAYVGFLNTGAVVRGYELTLRLWQSYRVSGDVDFNPGTTSVNRAIANRSMLGTGPPLDAVWFWVADLSGQGAFRLGRGAAKAARPDVAQPLLLGAMKEMTPKGAGRRAADAAQVKGAGPSRADRCLPQGASLI